MAERAVSLSYQFEVQLMARTSKPKLEVKLIRILLIGMMLCKGQLTKLMCKDLTPGVRYGKINTSIFYYIITN